MNYRKDKYGNDISVLGYGCMRFTQKLGRIDVDKAEKEIMEALDKGVNYFDTAYVYKGSEAALGEILRRTGIRDRIYIASKLPYYLVKDTEGCEKIFREQLRRLGTDHIDYYLIHMLTDAGKWEMMCDWGIADWIAAKKTSGEIGQIGFSYHGNSDIFKEIIDCYDWDFSQIQYNYLDHSSQAGAEGLKYSFEKGIPVIVMEPLRGGRLVNNLPKKAKELIDTFPVKRSPAEWALKWLWNQKEIMTVLSGMNDMSQVDENIRIACDTVAGSLTPDDFDAIEKIRAAIEEKTRVNCTSCRYCMPCPKGVDIPTTFAAYNRYFTDGKIQAWSDYFIFSAIKKESPGPANCVSCGKCTEHCPQHIDIPAELRKARKTLEFPGYGIGKAVGRKFLKLNK